MIGQSAATLADQIGPDTYIGRAALYLCRIGQGTAILIAIEGDVTRWQWTTTQATRRLTVPPQSPRP